MTPPVTVDVVVCVHDARRRPILEALLEVVDAELIDGDHLVVVADRAPALASDLRAAWPGITVVENSGAAGLSGARNQGIRVSDGDIVVFFDDDAVPRPGWRATIARRFIDHSLFVLGGAVDALWQERTSRPAWFPAAFGWVVGCDYEGMPPDGPIRGPIGACMAVRREAFGRYGLFVEGTGRLGSLPVGGEETELSMRIAAAHPGAVIERDTSWGVDHHVPRGRQRVRYFLRRCFWEGYSKAQWAAHYRGLSALAPERAHVARIVRDAAVDLFPCCRSRAGDTPIAAALALIGLGVTAAGFVRGRSARTPPILGASFPGAPLVSIVLCTLGRSAYLHDSVQALLGQTTWDIEVIVVDNAPGTGAVSAALAGVEDQRLRVIPEAETGLSAARNRGIVSARAEVVAFTDDDALADADWLESILNAFADDPDAACVTGRVLPVSTARAAEAWFEMGMGFDKGTVPQRWAGRSGGVVDSGIRGALYPYAAGEFGSGNNMAFRRATFRRVRGFARSLGAGTPAGGGEDLDMFRRVILAGFVIRYEPRAVVRHHHRRDLDCLVRQMYFYGSGMAASVSRYCVTTPWGLTRILPRLPAAARMLWDPVSPKNDRKSAEYPSVLDRAERRGYAAGALRYVHGAARAILLRRRQERRLRPR